MISCVGILCDVIFLSLSVTFNRGGKKHEKIFHVQVLAEPCEKKNSQMQIDRGACETYTFNEKYMLDHD